MSDVHLGGGGGGFGGENAPRHHLKCSRVLWVDRNTTKHMKTTSNQRVLAKKSSSIRLATCFAGAGAQSSIVARCPLGQLSGCKRLSSI